MGESVRRTCAAGVYFCVLTVISGGCGSGGPKPLNPTSFVQPNPDTRVDTRRGPLEDRPGALLYDNARVDLMRPGGPLAPPEARPDDSKQVNGVSETVRDSVRTPTEAATQGASIYASNGLPQPPATGPTPGEYMTLGAVVVEVNGNPIYANKVLSNITQVLAVRAREVEAAQFRAIAEDEVERQVGVLIRTELEFAAAQRNLDQHDRTIADQLTMEWRQQQITQAGGSLEMARSRAKAEGRDFDDLAQEQYRVEMRRIYFQKKEFPKVQVSADDMRQFYAKHKEELFVDHDAAKFRLIKIGVEQTGGRDQALAKIQDLHDRAVKGEDFAELAGSTNDDPALLKAQGDAGFGDWIQRGAFANEQVEDAVWKLQAGDVTPIIDEGRALYIAKLEQKKMGRSRPFEDSTVQALIRRSLEAEQFNALRDKAFSDLRKEAIIFPDPPQYEPAVEMAMQMYPRWSKK